MKKFDLEQEFDENLNMHFYFNEFYNLNTSYQRILGTGAIEGESELTKSDCQAEALPIDLSQLAENECKKGIIMMLNRCYFQSVIDAVYESHPIVMTLSDSTQKEMTCTLTSKPEISLKEDVGFSGSAECRSTELKEEIISLDFEMRGRFRLENPWLAYEVNDLVVDNMNPNQIQMTPQNKMAFMKRINNALKKQRIPILSHAYFQILNPEVYVNNGFLQICTDTDI